MCLRDDLIAFCDMCLGPDAPIVGTCGHCNVRDLELHRVDESCNAWPLTVACAPCCAELLADADDAVDHEARENVCDLCGGMACEVCCGLPSRVGGF